MIDPQDIYNKAMAAAEDWADKQHAAGVLSDALDALKGNITAELKAKGESISIIQNLVKKDERWVEMAKQVRDAEKAANIAKMKYEQVNRWQDNVRTKESTERALAR